jgi:hypothetical protein
MNEFRALFQTWEINCDGMVRNKTTKRELKQRLRRDGYVDIKLNYKRYLVHRLIAIVFIPNPLRLPQINHIDGVRNNNDISNLEWVDQFQNMEHAIKTGLFPDRAGVKNGRATISEDTARQIKLMLAKKISNTAIAKELNVSYGVVTNIKRGIAWKNT